MTDRERARAFWLTYYEAVDADTLDALIREFAAVRAEERRGGGDDVSLSTRSLRPSVLAFALAMEERLRANDHKGGWKDCDVYYLTGRLQEEVFELERAVLVGYGEEPDAGDVRTEAADVANFALMLADVVGALVDMDEKAG